MKMLCALESCFYNSGQGRLLTAATNHSSRTLGVCFTSYQSACYSPSPWTFRGENHEILKGVMKFQAIRLLERFYCVTFVLESESVCIV